MKRFLGFLLSCAILLSLLPLSVFAEEESGMHYTYRDIVRRTYDMRYLATEPKPGEGGKQVTSVDPASRYNEETGTDENWGANADMTGYVRVNPENGYRVLADLKGPGYLTHIMTGQNWPGRLHIWIDGELVVNGSFVDFVWGSYFKAYDQLSFKSNYVNMTGFADGYQGCINLFVPITYNESCLVEIDCDVRSGFYYTVGYYDLEDGATVEPFSLPLSEENRAALAEANAILADGSVPYGDTRFEETIAPGQTATLFESAVSGALSAMTLKLDIPQEQFDDRTSLVDWQLAMYWDGSDTPAVNLTAADFFANPYGLYGNVFNSAAFGTAADGTLYSKWYLPFRSAKITLTNNSTEVRAVKATFRPETLSDAEADALTRFHANWQRSHARTDDRAPDAQMLSVEGKGRYVGTSLHIFQIVDGIWWGEGDEKFFIDGEKYPTWFGTGSEDYFCYAWCASDIFDFAYCGQTHNDGSPSDGDHQVQGHGDKANYRLHILDNVCFTTSFEANIEKYWEDEAVKYAATTFFYLTAASSQNHRQTPVTRAERLFNEDMLSGSTLFYPGIYLTGRQLSTNTAVPISQQGMSGVCAGEYEWYGNGQLFWPVTARGKQANFLIEIPESGTYDLAASFTTAPDYGTFRISIDGEAIGKPTDLYGTIAQKNLTLGAVNLTAGTHILTIECTGKNAASSGHALGLNYLKFEPHTDRPQTASVYLKGSSDLLRAVTDCTTEGRPHDQGLDPAISDDGSHLFWAPSEGGTFTFKVSAPMSGLYTIETGYTCYRDFGKFALYLDGVQIGEIYDAYDTELKVKKAVIENVPVTEGDHCITVKCVGKNDASSGIVFGMDYFKMAGESAALPLTVLAAAFYGGSRDLLRVLQTYTSSEAPYDQGLDPAISDDGSHLFWRSAVGDTADFRIDLPIDAVYTLTAAYTCAGDFAQFEWLLDGEKLGETYDAYAAGVAVKTLTTEAIKLGAGTHTLTLRCAGKDAASAGTVLGIDYVRFDGTFTEEKAEIPGDDILPGQTLTHAQKAALAELRAYTEAAIAASDALHEAPLRMEMANGMRAICRADDPAAALAAAKAAIDAVAAAVCEETLEIDLFDYDGLFFEGADLAGAVKACTAANLPVSQGTPSGNWSNSAHLFWMPDAAGNELELSLNVEIAGTYEFELGYTTAPDYGTFDLYLDGEKRGSIDGYGEVDAHTVLLSEVTLAEGEHRLKLVVTGKNEASANLALGLDHVFFRGDVSLAQYQLAAAKALKAYKSSENYSSEQWALVEAELARQIEAINACTTVEEVLAAWTTGKAKLDAIESGYYDYDHPKFDETKTPADFGWRTDGDNYTNWQVAAEGEPLCVRYTGKDSKRIWKQLIQNPDNFTVKLTAKVVDLRAAIEIMGVSIELNCENGNGNQIFDREGWQWFDAKHQLCEVTISRTDGGDLTITLKGAGNSTPVIYAKTPVNPADKNVYLGVLDAGGSAFFSDVTAGGEAPEEPIEGESPDEFGWDTDEPKDFSGWTATDAANVAAVYDKTTGNHRIWKGLLTNQKDFTAELDITTNNKSSAYVKVLGVTLELDSRGGDGNQSFVKLNGRNHDWVKGEACEMHVKLERKDGGDLTVIVTGKNGDKMDLTATPTEENENLELGLYAGTAKYESIAVTCKEIEPTTFLVTFVDGLTGETIAVRTVETGEAATAPAAPEHEGYTFKGWDKAFDNVTENLTVTAIYEKNPVEYTVTFVDGLTKETIATVKVEAGKAATAPAAPEHEGYTFKGWDKAFDNVTENLTVTALYEKNPVEYTVTFVDGLTKETIATVKVEESKAATAPAAPEHEGYTFKGWDKAFDNVTENLTVTAIYEKNAEPAKPWVNPFKDVKSSDWFYEGVKFANQQELFNGTAPDTFSPDDAMTRAMLVTVLWRLDGKTTPTKTSGFVDVPSKAYYTEAVAWAAENGIVNGTDATHFAPNDEVTREQIAAILFRYAEKKGVDTTKRADLNAFPDANKVSAYAKDALAWANAEGLVRGSNENGKDYLIPTGSATRAQVATILARYAQNIVK